MESLDDDLAAELHDGILRGPEPIAADDGAIALRVVVAFMSATRLTAHATPGSLLGVELACAPRGLDGRQQLDERSGRSCRARG